MLVVVLCVWGGWVEGGGVGMGPESQVPTTGVGIED